MNVGVPLFVKVTERERDRERVSVCMCVCVAEWVPNHNVKEIVSEDVCFANFFPPKICR